jgi:hypothetical protein
MRLDMYVLMILNVRALILNRYFRVNWPTPFYFADFPRFTSYDLIKISSVTPFDDLPNELLLQIHKELPFLSCMSLWSTCKSLRTLLTDSDFTGRVLKEAILCGHLRWIFPMESMPLEVFREDTWGEPHLTEIDAAIDQWYKDSIV